MKKIVQVEKLIDHNKWRAAFLAPFGLTLAGVVERYVENGVWDSSSTRLAVGGALAATASAFFTWLVPAGKALVTVPTTGTGTFSVSTPTLEPVNATPIPDDDGNDGDDALPTALLTAPAVTNPDLPSAGAQAALGAEVLAAATGGQS